MITCSNCGAVARPGAKFCTTCGSRLNSVEAPAAETSWLKPDATQAPEPETQQTATAPSWTWGAPQEPEAETVIDAPPESTDTDTAQTEPSPATTSWSWNQPATALPESETSVADPETGQIASSVDSDEPIVPDAPQWSWGSTVADEKSDPDDDSPDADEVTSGEVGEVTESVTAVDGTPGTTATTTTTESVEETSDQVADGTDPEIATASGSAEDVDVSSALTDDSDEDQQETLSSWAARWNSDQDDESEQEVSTSPDDSDDSAFNRAAADPSADTISGSAVDVPYESDDVLEDSVTDADESPALESPDVTPDTEESSSFLGIQGAPGGDPTALAVMESDSSAAAPAAASVDEPSAGDPLQRARTLLAELSDILPTLAVTTTTEKVVTATSDTSAIATTLEDALANTNRNRFADLRTVLESARSNPRDVDTMLGLVSHVDGLITLLDAHDHLEATIRDAVADLRDSASDGD